ncbi:MAG: SH3 domain-containing protein [Candidatus Limiplasma sp.]|nr:SH3 domain-containing protein [Candidatus Limiplasma sp.]
MAKKFFPGIKGKIAVEDLLYVRKKVGDGDFEKVESDYLRPGVIVELLELDDNRFYRIDYKGRDGYIYKDYVELL